MVVINTTMSKGPYHVSGGCGTDADASKKCVELLNAHEETIRCDDTDNTVWYCDPDTKEWISERDDPKKAVLHKLIYNLGEDDLHWVIHSSRSGKDKGYHKSYGRQPILRNNMASSLWTFAPKHDYMRFKMAEKPQWRVSEWNAYSLSESEKKKRYHRLRNR